MPVGEFGHSHYFSLVFKFGQVKQAENVMTGAENPDNSDAMPSSDYNLIDDANRQNPNAQ